MGQTLGAAPRGLQSHGTGLQSAGGKGWAGTRGRFALGHDSSVGSGLYTFIGLYSFFHRLSGGMTPAHFAKKVENLYQKKRFWPIVCGQAKKGANSVKNGVERKERAEICRSPQKYTAQ